MSEFVNGDVEVGQPLSVDTNSHLSLRWRVVDSWASDAGEPLTNSVGINSGCGVNFLIVVAQKNKLNATPPGASNIQAITTVNSRCYARELVQFGLNLSGELLLGNLTFVPWLERTNDINNVGIPSAGDGVKLINDTRLKIGLKNSLDLVRLTLRIGQSDAGRSTRKHIEFAPVLGG